MTQPSVLNRYLKRLPDWYERDGVYVDLGLTAEGDYIEEGMTSKGELAEMQSIMFGVTDSGNYFDALLNVTGYNNYKFCSLVSQGYRFFQKHVEGVKKSHQINFASGINIDRIGKIFGLDRGDFEDDGLRRYIKSAVIGLVGGGTTANLKAALAITLDIPESNIIITDLGAANFKIYIPEMYIDIEPDIRDTIDKYKPAGVSYSLAGASSAIWNESFWDECVWR